MIRPIGSYIVVELQEKEEKAINGIYIPETASKEKPQTGLVIAVGPGRVLENGTRLAPDVNAGDNVVFTRYSGTEIKVENKSYLILTERDILAITK